MGLTHWWQWFLGGSWIVVCFWFVVVGALVSFTRYHWNRRDWPGVAIMVVGILMQCCVMGWYVRQRSVAQYYWRLVPGIATKHGRCAELFRGIESDLISRYCPGPGVATYPEESE